MSEVPKGWIQTKLGDLGNYVNGRAFKPAEWKDSGLPIIRIQNLNDPKARFNYSDKEHEEKYRVKSGDLLVAWSASLGTFIWERGDAWLNQHIFRVEPRSDIITKEFLHYAVKEAIAELYTKAHGSGMVHVTKPVFESHEIPLPPLNEQKRIVEKLEKLLGRVEAVQARLDKIPAILKRFRQSVLAAACSGKLTADWREDPCLEDATALLERIKLERNSKAGRKSARNPSLTNEPFSIPETWSFCFLDDIAANKPHAVKAGPFGSSLTKSMYVESGFKIYGQEQVIRGNPYYGDYYIDAAKFDELKSCEVSAGDLLVSLVGTIGKTLILPDDFEPGIINPRLVKFSLHPRVLNRFIQTYLDSTLAQNQMSQHSHGGTMEILNLGILRSLAIPLPPAEEQKEIVRRVEELFNFADAVEERYKKANAHTDKLTQSILAKAFRGELVPQDPNDEPASVMLQRISKAAKN